MSDSVRPHRQQSTRLPRPWDSPGKNTGVGCHFLLQCMKVKSESEAAQSCPTLCDRMDCSLPGSTVLGIFQARVLEWGAIAFSGKYSFYTRKKVYSVVVWDSVLFMSLRSNWWITFFFHFLQLYLFFSICCQLLKMALRSMTTDVNLSFCSCNY